MRSLLAVAAAAALLASASATIVMPSVFGDHMVLQTNSEYGARSFFYGEAIPGETITVNLDGRVYEEVASSSGSWTVQLNPGGGKVKSATVSGSKSTNKLSFSDVVFGDVILCSGQSNMVFPVDQAYDASSILAQNASDGSDFRILSVSRSAQQEPQKGLNMAQACTWKSPTPSSLPCSTWTPVSPDAVAPFSALCYTTALYWHQMSGRPVGIINSAWGGTPVESWMPEDAFAMCPQFPPTASYEHEAGAPGSADGALPAPAPGAAPFNQYNDSSLFNGMIAPLVGFSVRFAVWDQGERNVREDFSEQKYSCYFGAMINSWRDLWGIGDFAFIFAQLAPYEDGGNITSVRMAQYDALARRGGFMDTTGMISQIDLGDIKSPYGSVHSRNKTEAGRRSALQALHVMQGIQDVPFSWAAPTGAGAASGDAGSFTISFDNETLYNGTIALVPAPDCTLCCRDASAFQVAASAAGPWFNATAVVSRGGTALDVTPSAGAPSSPAFVRHAASNFPQCVIENAAGIPTVPFILPVGAAVPTASTRFEPHRPLLYAGANKGTLPASMGGFGAPAPIVGNVTRPPLYWNSWNAAHCNMDARLAMIQGDLAVKNGLFFAKGGHVVHDDCWQVQRWANGSLRADPARYPNGVIEVSEYLNGKGLGFGLYEARGSRTCQNRPGAYGHEKQDAQYYYDNRISYQKMDDCGGTQWPEANKTWILFRDAFQELYGKENMPVMSIEYCHSTTDCGKWIMDTTNMARTTGDIQANIASILSNADNNNGMAPVQGPQAQCSYYNDPDMLEVGAAGVSFNQSVVQLGLWSIMGSPLGLSIDIRSLGPEYIDLLTNEELLAVDQDPVCVQGTQISSTNGLDVWARKLANGDVAVALLNRNETPAASISAKLSAIGIASGKAKVRDVINKADAGVADSSVSASNVAPTSLVLYRLTPM